MLKKEDAEVVKPGEMVVGPEVARALLNAGAVEDAKGEAFELFAEGRLGGRLWRRLLAREMGWSKMGGTAEAI